MARLITIIVLGGLLFIISGVFDLPKAFLSNAKTASTADTTGRISEEQKSEVTFARHMPSEENAVITLKVQVKGFSAVDLYVADEDGNRIRTLLRKHLPSGTYQVSWFGESEIPGKTVPGDYIVTLDSRDVRRMIKVQLGEIRVSGPSD